ncbi:hypothetical protein OESDEN_06923 [Oesophagostomum dentatum]|uniref:Uncharacterized protein n=1 Tax=Oesophagostomum dentatum TaxID=61180 RepID=A0A0B1TAP1_OESDE|nr:hypothetical protein OESDEN_06923 [Oesophagostomum dentatum]
MKETGSSESPHLKVLLPDDFRESPIDYPLRNIDIVDVCNEQQRRLEKREEHHILTRADRENSEICRFLLRMVRVGPFDEEAKTSGKPQETN